MILIILLFLILLNIYLKIKKYNIDLFFCIVILLVLYAGLKSNYSIDYKNYFIHFSEINVFQDVLNTNFEKGYSLIILLFKFAGLGFHTFLLFIAFISIRAKGKVITRFSIYPDISLLIYFLLFFLYNDVEQIRHGIAIALCLYSLIYLMKNDKRSKIISVSLTILAFFMHTSAILFIPVYFIKDRLFTSKTYIIVFFISIILSFVNWFEVGIFFNENFINSSYISLKINEYKSETQSIFNISLLLKMFIISTFYLFSFNKENRFHRLYFNIYYLGIIISCLLTNMPIISARGSLYMRYIEIFIIPVYINSIKYKTNKKLHYFILLVLFIYYFYKFFSYVLTPEYFVYTSI